MKRSLLLISSLLLAASTQAATLLEFNFDSQSAANQYADQSGNGRNVTFTQTVSLSTDNPFSVSNPELTGIDKSASTSSGYTGAGAVSGISNINLSTNNQFTLEGWVKPESLGAIGVLFDITSTAGGTSSYSLRYTEDGTVQGRYYSLSMAGGIRTIDTEVQLSLNEWTHLAYVKTVNAVELYINGEQVVRFLESGITSRNQPSSLDYVTIGRGIVGQFDDFRFSDTALSASELGFHAPFTVIPEPSSVAMLLGGGIAGVLALVRRKKQS